MRDDFKRLNNLLLERDSFQNLPQIIELITKINKSYFRKSNLLSEQESLQKNRIMISLVDSERWRKERKFHFKSAYIEKDEIERYIDMYYDENIPADVKVYVEYILKSVYFKLNSITHQLESSILS